AVEAVAIDARRRERLHADALGAADDRVEELFTLRLGELLRVVEEGERPDFRAAERLVVEQHAGDEERSRERAAAGLVGADDVAGADPPVEAKKLLARPPPRRRALRTLLQARTRARARARARARLQLRAPRRRALRRPRPLPRELLRKLPRGSRRHRPR